ncbi:hypothetical protein SODALDRAFT_327239, partial [Sodiomyces alkalinus F11]
MQPGLRPRLKSRPSLVELLSRARDDHTNQLWPALGGATSSPSTSLSPPQPPPLYLDRVTSTAGTTREGPLIPAASSTAAAARIALQLDVVAQASVQPLPSSSPSKTPRLPPSSHPLPTSSSLPPTPQLVLPIENQEPNPTS